MAKEPLKEGDTRFTDLPPPETVMIERMIHGKHFLDIQRKGIVVSTVLVKDYTSWDDAFDAVMVKAGL